MADNDVVAYIDARLRELELEWKDYTAQGARGREMDETKREWWRARINGRMRELERMRDRFKT